MTSPRWLVKTTRHTPSLRGGVTQVIERKSFNNRHDAWRDYQAKARTGEYETVSLLTTEDTHEHAR